MTRPVFGICVSASLLLATSGCALFEGTGYTSTAASDAGPSASSGGAQTIGSTSPASAPQAGATGSGSTTPATAATPAGASEPGSSDPGSTSSSASSSGSSGGSDPFSKGASGQKIALPNVNLIESGGGSPVIMDPDKSIVGSTTLQNSINPQSQQINVQGLNPGAFQIR